MPLVTRRVRRPQDKESLVREIGGDDGKIFRHLRDVLRFAAVLGYARGRREPFEQSAEAIPWEVFANGAGNEALVDLIGVATTGTVEILSDERFGERLTLFEEYANGGLAVLTEEIGQAGGKPRDVVLLLILSAEDQVKDESEIDLSGMIDQILR